MKKKKILHIVESFGGGVFTVLVDILNGISDEYEVVIAYSKRKQTPENFEKYFNDNIRFIEVKNFTREIKLKKELGALKEVRKIVKEEKPNIVHLHSSKAGIIGRVGIHDCKIKMFYNPHGFSFLKKDDSIIKRAIYWLIEKGAAIVNRKCTIIGCSNGEYEEAKKLNKNSICINNGINIVNLEKETKDLKEKEIEYDNLKICTVGRISYQKNPSLFNAIAKKFPNIKFTWIGDGALKNELNEKNLNITGWVNREEVLQILNNNDIFLLTSLWEGLPISLLEAMYMKKICIVSNVIGNRDVIKNKINGFICNDLEQFESVIKSIKNKDYNTNVAKEAQIDVIENYCEKNMIKRYKDIYKG